MVPVMTHLEEENIRLRRAVEELSILNEIAVAISSTMELNKIVDLVVQKCVKHLKCEQAAVMLLDEKTEDRPLQTMIRKADRTQYNLPYRLDAHLTGWMLKHQKALLINDVKNDERLKGTVKNMETIHSLLCVPLILKGRMIGVLAVFNKKVSEGFGTEDQRLLAIIAAQSAQVIENARLYDEEQTLIRMQEEIRLASNIQLGLLPTESPEIPGYDIAGMSLPAQVVGGDYFDFIKIDNSRFAFCLGDVSGKGLPAAMLMANLQATIRGQVLVDPNPGECLGKSNKLLFRSTDSYKFVTLFFGILNFKTHKICFSNAGHNRPVFLKKKQDPTFLKSAGIALSFLEDHSYQEATISMDPGDVLLVYSDGITEAMNVNHEEFSEELLISVIQENFDSNVETLNQAILAAVKKHIGDHQQSDDMTLLTIKRVAK